MTLKAPRHLERITLPSDLHFRYRPMTDVAVQATSNMDAVIEVHELRNLVHQVPLNRCIRFIALPNRLQHRTVCPDLAMTGHTGFSGW